MNSPCLEAVFECCALGKFVLTTTGVEAEMRTKLAYKVPAQQGNPSVSAAGEKTAVPKGRDCVLHLNIWICWGK